MPSAPAPTELSEADAPEIASLYGRCAEYFLLQDGVEPGLADAYELFSDVPLEKNAHDQTVLGCRYGDGLNAIAAILCEYPRAGTWYLGFMIVDTSYRGQGLGRSIYAAIEEWVVARGGREIRLAVLEANEPGKRFWRSLDFGQLRRVGPDTFKLRNHYRIELGRHINAGFPTGDDQ